MINPGGVARVGFANLASEFVTSAPTPIVWLAFAGKVFGESGNLMQLRCIR